jgi:hypothetical protein
MQPKLRSQRSLVDRGSVAESLDRGILCTPKRAAGAWFAPTSTLVSRALPRRHCGIERRRQGPAGLALLGPEIDDDRGPAGALEARLADVARHVGQIN